MQISQQLVNGVTVFRLGGRFDAHEVPTVRKTLGSVDGAAAARRVINLADVGFIDSSGLSALIQAMKHSREAGGDLHLCALAEPVRIIFELTRLDQAFAIFADEAAAIAAFSGEPPAA